MEYNERIERIEEIIGEINSGNVDPVEIMKKIEEAKKLLKECEKQLKQLTIDN
ncbi:MAG: exodeoxyribonuclease VII small subunit [Paludibacteraceae bacterium]|nr:exodeoxyribonuclease VII small subunit [Paludibacteraceae bacterium]